MSRTVGTALLVVLAALALVVAVIGLLRGGENDDAFKLDLGVATEASVSELREFATPTRPVYWVGPPKAGRLEVTRTSGEAVYVRYLPEGAELGDRAPKYTTIGTYPQKDAYKTMVRTARRRDFGRQRLDGGGIAVWRRSPGTSVYVAYPRVGYLVEVYDPSARRARSLATGGRVERVP